MTRDPAVDDWLAGQPAELREALAHAREVILASDDRVTEAIKWKTPTFSYKGNILSFTGGAKSHVSLMFHRGADIPGDHPRLEGDGRLVRTMRLRDREEVETARSEIEAVVSSWCRWRDQ